MTLVTLVTLGAVTASAEMVFDYTVGLVDSMDLQGDPDNVVDVVDVASELGLPAGTPLTITGIGWDIWLATNPATNSDLSESVIYFDENVAPGSPFIMLQPGVGDNFGGTEHYTSPGIVDLTDNGLDDVLLPDGLLRVEFFEDSKDDLPNEPDATWRDGLISIQVVPEPGSLLLMGLGVLVWAGRRRIA